MQFLRLFTRTATAALAPAAEGSYGGARRTEAPGANEPSAQGFGKVRAAADALQPSADGVAAPESFAGVPDAPWQGDSNAADFTRPRPPLRTPGLLSTPELAAYFGTNHHASGRYHGCRYRSEHAREQGLAALVTTFQNTVSEMTERRLARIDRLRLSEHDVAGLGEDLSRKIDLACAQTLREVDALREQHALAGQRQGWVLDALNRYRLGFDRGVRDAVDFELLDA